MLFVHSPDLDDCGGEPVEAFQEEGREGGKAGEEEGGREGESASEGGEEERLLV
jgi:hypothetical protein